MFEDYETVNCIDCEHFIRPAKQYDENSMGACQVMETWLNKFPNRRPSPEIYERNYAKLGGKVYWPYTDRFCDRFAAIKKAPDERGLNCENKQCNADSL